MHFFTLYKMARYVVHQYTFFTIIDDDTVYCHVTAYRLSNELVSAVRSIHATATCMGGRMSRVENNRFGQFRPVGQMDWGPCSCLSSWLWRIVRPSTRHFTAFFSNSAQTFDIIEIFLFSCMEWNDIWPWCLTWSHILYERHNLFKGKMLKYDLVN